MIFDAHVHFFSRRFFEVHAQLAGVGLDEVGQMTGADIPSDDASALADRWVLELKNNHVDRIVLIASVPGDEEAVAEAVRLHPRRFAGYFLLDPKSEKMLERAERALDELGLSGVCLFPAMHHYDPGDSHLFPLYELLQKKFAVCFVHTGLLKIPLREKLQLPPLTDLRYSNPLLLNRAANRYPSLTFVLPHFGGGMFHETLLLGAQCKNVCVDTSSSNSWMQLTPGLDLKTVFERTLAAYGPRRVLFGTDSSAFPRGWRYDLYSDQKRVLDSILLTPEERGAILGRNLERILGMGG